MGAGLFNVSAERSISWPEKQEIGELKLDFIRLSKNVGAIRFAIISTIPLLVGMAVVWHIANNILNMPAIWAEVNRGALSLGEAISRLSRASDFWIWVYLAFTVSNTMMPNFGNLRGWRIVIGIVAALVVALYALGAGDQIIMNNLRGPVTDALNSLSTIFAIIIVIDIFMVAVLGTIEASIERITGNSATFENGKMITLSRSELLERRRKALTPASKTRQTKVPAVPAGPPSVYKLHFPIPGAPGKEATTPDATIVITPEAKPALSSPASSVPAVISGNVTEKLPAPSISSSQPASPQPSIVSPAATSARPAPNMTPGTSPAGGGQTLTGSRPTTPQSPGASPVGREQIPATPFVAGAAPAGGARPAIPQSPSTSSVGGGHPPATPFAGGGTRPALPPSSSTGASGSGLAASNAKPPLSPFTSTGAKPVSPVPKPVLSPKPLDDDYDDEEEDEDDGDVSYKDFEDPA